jgi:hypothetical protein
MVRENPEFFNEALQLAISDNLPYSWRAAWLLWSCMEENDIRIKNYVTEIINILPNRQDNQKRELLKVLLMMELEDDDESQLFDLCVSLWENTDKKPSIRHKAILVIGKTAEKYPELIPEVSLLLQDHYLESLSPGVKRAIMKLMKKLDNSLMRD